MGFHGTTTGQNIHVIHRWLAADELERHSISANPDNTPITEKNGLHCLCLQEDTGIYYRCASVEPIEWVSIFGVAHDQGQ